MKPLESVNWRDQPEIGRGTYTLSQARFSWDSPDTTQWLALNHRTSSV